MIQLPPSLAVIIPTRNRRELLKTCLHALTRAPVGAIDAVVVADDGSDNAHEVTEIVHDTFLGMRASISVVRHDQAKGPASARNLAAKHSTADLLWFIDDDVEIMADAPITFKRAATRFPNTALAGGVNIKSLSTPPAICESCSIDYPLAVTADRRCEPGEVWGCNFVLPSTLFRIIGGFRETASIYGEEFELLTRVATLGHETRHVFGAEVNHLRSTADLLISNLIRRRLIRGYNQSRNAARFGWGMPTLSTEIRNAFNHLKHAQSSHCVAGLLSASVSIGRILGYEI